MGTIGAGSSMVADVVVASLTPASLVVFVPLAAVARIRRARDAHLATIGAR